ncbi:monovalent cation/H+ antiporter subunit A [Amphibiibacter pelophylacis]|uniref:Monovalent cation/H+ antiporter subunit A n=1 Tax=Amphibiibacter pelophylacis TaxID=1799477 RepID=A0ACC6P0A8_9BURK
MLIWIIVLPLLAGTVMPLWLGARSRLAAAVSAGGIAALVLALLLSAAPQVLAGGQVLYSLPWVPDLGLSLSLRLDALSLLFALLISGIGVLIVIYAHGYLGRDDPAGKFFSTMMLFMAAMLGVVLSDNVLLLAVFWELTSISSFLLVGYWSHRPDARAGARQALAVTGGGGLALLGGMVLLGQIAGTYDISAMLGRAAEIQAQPGFGWALALILLGCFTKSAQFPFHFWLPDAMAAPTPVSAYLHSATMVKAGIFLLMRLNPVLAGSGWFEGACLLAGLVTCLFAAWVALFKHDLKGLLAYSTVSHLGLVVALIGLGSPLALAAAVFHVINHASFKAALFMTAGIVDHETGTRDLRRLGGLAALMPWTATLALIAGAAMAGVPLTNGFLSKEMFFTEVVAVPQGLLSLILPLVVTLAGAGSVAYSLRLVHDTFWNGPARDLPVAHPHDPPWAMRGPVLLLAVICLAVGLLPALLAGPMVYAAALSVLGGPAVGAAARLPELHLSLWHGLNLPLAMSALALGGGVWVYARLMRGRVLHRLESEALFGRWTGRAMFERSMATLWSGAGQFSLALDPGSLQRHLAWILGATALVLVGALWDITGQVPWTGGRPLLPAPLMAWAVWLLALGASWALVHQHRDRLAAVVWVGVVGLATSLAFLALSAPDLALTQISVEVASTVLMLMALAFLPQHAPLESSPARRWRDGLIAVLCGLGVGLLAWFIMTRDHESISWYFLQAAQPLGGGTNVVNVILVDFRGYDTFGEINVLAVAALGAWAVLEGFYSRRAAQDTSGRRWSAGGTSPLLRTAAAVVLPLALAYTLYIFLRGHNLPGGGFIAGLITSLALLLQYMVLGQTQVDALLRAAGGERLVRLLAWGLAIAGMTGLGAMLLGHPFLTSAFGHPILPVLGELPLATAALFDLGVYLTVVGATLLMVSTLGAAGRPSQPAPAARKGGA